MTSPTVARQIVVHGKVQGVFFRSTARDKAVLLGLKGTVANQTDGTVRIRVEGTAEAVDSFTEWCWTGPPRAEVEGVESEDKSPIGFLEFRIER